MKVLKVIHGFPPYYMAGSEIYSYNLVMELAKQHDVNVFTRIESPFLPLYSTKEETIRNVDIYRVNKPPRDYTFRAKYLDETLDPIYEDYLKRVNPDVVHIGHLSHLSTNIVPITKKLGFPIVFTLHDFWLMCLRGQLITGRYELCTGPAPEKCQECFRLYFLSEQKGKTEVERWMDHLENIIGYVDIFIAPSRYLMRTYLDFGIEPERIRYMDYGFDTSLIERKEHTAADKPRFGYMGRIIPSKGIHILIEAFNKMDDRAVLNIFGASTSDAIYLKEMVKNCNIHFKGGFDNREIKRVLKEIDVMVVPSIWYENSPLVIHEAFLAGIPVIASDLGGMAEYVKDGKNGLLFEVDNADDLYEKLIQFVNNPELINKLSSDGKDVISIEEDANRIVSIYRELSGN